MTNYMSQLVDETYAIDHLIRNGINFSQEGQISTFFDNSKESFSNFLNKLHDIYVRNKFGNYKPIRILIGPNITKLTDGSAYLDAATKSISVPIGFKGTYTGLNNDLVTVYEKVHGLSTNLTKITSFVVKLINDPALLRSQAGLRDLNKLIDESCIDMDLYTRTMGYFGNGTRTRVMLKDVANNGTSFLQTFKDVQKLNDRYSGIDYGVLDSKVLKLSEVLGDLGKLLPEEVISGNSISTLSDLTYRLGTTVTLLSTIVTVLTDWSNCLNRNNHELN